VSALVQVSLWDHGVPFVIALPDQVKTHFTSYTNATKEQMVQQAKTTLGFDVTDDEADAYALARIARDMYFDSAETRKAAKVICKLREQGRLHEPPTANRPNAYGVAPGG
jgi:Holliday junction resolvasome RuvABC endonuclease subunit